MHNMRPEVPKFSRRDFLKAMGIFTLAFASGCVEPTISPNPTDPSIPTATETFIPTETPTPTESVLKNYQANIVDVTALYKSQPTADNPIKAVYDSWISQSKEIPNLADPHIWTLQITDNLSGLEESVVLAQDEFLPHDTYILNIISKEGETPQLTKINSELFAQVVMGNDGTYQNVEYYYKDSIGTKKDILTYKQDAGKFVYTMQNGQKVELNGLGIYFGKFEDPSTGGKLLSLVPPGENFYKTLPAGAVINTESKEILDSSGVQLYHFEYGRWQKPLTYESGASLEFSPLFGEIPWHKEWVGKVQGLDIPVIIGISQDVYDSTSQIKGVWMTQGGADSVADAFLREAHYRYTKVMGNSVTYEEYLNILKSQPRGGEVNLLITDNELDADGQVVRREALIDPRQGFSLLLADKIDPKMGVVLGRKLNVFFGVDGQGRLLAAPGDSLGFYRDNQHDFRYGMNFQDYDFIWGSFVKVGNFADAINKCIANGNVMSQCGESRAPVEMKEWWQLEFSKGISMLDNGYFTSPWGLEK